MEIVCGTICEKFFDELVRYVAVMVPIPTEKKRNNWHENYQLEKVNCQQIIQQLHSKVTFRSKRK